MISVGEVRKRINIDHHAGHWTLTLKLSLNFIQFFCPVRKVV